MNSKLTSEEREILELMMQAYEKIKAIPDSQIVHIPDTNKYNFPLGFDDSGKQFPVEYTEVLNDKPIKNE